MATISSGHIEKPIKSFNCRVLRPECHNVLYTPPRWENWTVLAETEGGARMVAEYHFYRSDPNNIIITQSETE